MKRSTDRILTSHAGSLHRPDDLREAMAARRDGDPFDDKLTRRVKEAVFEVVRLQAENGVDVVNDGEYTKRSWQTYARGRLAGLEQRPLTPDEDPAYGSITARESRVFPEFFQRGLAGFGRPPGVQSGGGFAQQGVFCVGPLTYIGQEEYRRDIAWIKAAAAGVPVADLVLTALAPATIEHWMRNQYYKTQEEMLFAIAEAMHEEYKAITDAGIILQLDDPDLPDGYHVYPEMSVAEYRRFAEVRVEAINHAIRGIPEEMVRLHICWGSFHHPHTQDIPLRDIIDIVFKVKAQCYSIEASNPQHEHEWEVFEEVKLPDGKILMPGVLGHCAPEFVEHPRLVAQRLIRYANLVGRENVIGGTDCGLSRVAHPSIQWAKFRAMAEGARIASAALW
ncbi:MAG: cobalamin-independent methionine synthase II family protein [Chloroflexi bacterium]|nr:cobalamin-independent methionine synthase II family protein [Chloroflexota bacterium]